MRKLARVIAWSIKSVLFALTLGALVFWPLSCGRYLRLDADYYNAGPSWATWRTKAFHKYFWGKWRGYRIACCDGWVIASRGWKNPVGVLNSAGVRHQVDELGSGWEWRRVYWPATWEEGKWFYRRGPFRWSIYRMGASETGITHYDFAAPFWIVIPVIGAWPFSSIAFALHRRIERRRATRQGLCPQCGYDLRATPHQCPECGMRQTHAPPAARPCFSPRPP